MKVIFRKLRFGLLPGLVVFLLIIDGIMFSGSAQEIREIKAVFANSSPVVDGNLNEGAWLQADVQGDFVQLEPHLGSPATQKTEVMVLFDEDNLYVGFRCFMDSPEDIVSSVTRRDKLGSNDDHVAILLDSFYDLRNGYLFVINPIETQKDGKIANDGRSNDMNWDSGWSAETAINEWGWSAEFAIPFKILRFRASENMVWGINFGRFDAKNLEKDWWSGKMKEAMRVSQGGILTGLRIIPKRQDIHIIPYSTARREVLSEQGIQGEWKEQLGLDIEYNPAANFTSNITFNPDFASVEGDQEKINLTRFELSFPEKRRFFLEGSELFRNRINIFYSRRIGDIKYGGKLTGKGGNFNMAMLSVQAKETEDDPLTGENESFPESNVSVVRIQRDILKSSTIGLLAVNKSWNSGYNRVISLDATLNLPHNLYGTAQFVGAWPGNLRKNNAFFLRLARQTNIYEYHLRYTHLGENFRESVNSVGFIRDDDRHELDASGRYQYWMKKRGIEYIAWRSNYNAYWGHNKVLRSGDVWQRLQVYFSNKWSLTGHYQYEYKLYEKSFYNNKKSVTVGYNTEEWASKSFSYQWGKNFDQDFNLYTVSARFKPNPKLSLEYSLNRLKLSPDPKSESSFINIITLNYQFTPDLYIRLFTQNNTVNDRYYVYGVFGYRIKPPYGAVYIVYTSDEFETPLNRTESNRILFLKFSHSFDF